jgi:hypothetical protein
MILFILIKLQVKLEVLSRLLSSLKKSILENKNYLKIEEYYSNTYNSTYYEKEYYDKYKLEEYNGYRVVNGNVLELEAKQKQDKIKHKDWNKMNYLFELPLHIEVIDKLVLSMDRSRYKFISISYTCEERLYNVMMDDLYNLLGVYGKEINFVYYYQTYLGDRYICDNISIKNELLINIDIKNIENLLYQLKNNKELEKLKLEYNLDIKNELDFFRRTHMESLHERNVLTHTGHDFVVFKLNKELEDYYVLGNHIMRFKFERVIRIADNLNDVISEIDIINRTASKKNKIDINNPYLLESLNYYVLCNNNLSSTDIDYRELSINTCMMPTIFKKALNELASNHSRLDNYIINIAGGNMCEIEKKEKINKSINSFNSNNELFIQNYKNLSTFEMDENIYTIAKIANHQQSIYSNIRVHGVWKYFSDLINITSARNWQYKIEKFETANNLKILDSNGVYLNVEANSNTVVNTYGKDVSKVLNGHVSINVANGNTIRLHPCTHSETLTYNMLVDDNSISIKGKNKALYLDGSQYISTHPYIKEINVNNINFDNWDALEKNFHSKNGLVSIRNIIKNILENNIRPEMIKTIRDAQVDYSSFSVVRGLDASVSEEHIKELLKAYHAVYVIEKAAEFCSAVSSL